MIEGKRLEYVVPGYTGHIPKKVYDDGVPIEKKQGTSHIPGYAGYVHSIKPQNIHATTFGKITYDVNNNNYIKGQDLAPRHKYVSTQTSTNIPPSEMFSKTAANIVGIPNKQIKVKEPKLENSCHRQTNQFTIAKDESFRQSMRSQPNKWADTKLIEKEGKEYVRLNDKPLPGYTGFQERVMADNIFGMTHAKCRENSINNAQNLQHEKKKNFNNVLNSDIPLKF